MKIQLKNLFTFIAALFLLAGASADDGTRPPNFIVIFADDLGYQDIGCFGATKIKTPRLDRMAEEGMLFTSFYAQTVCGPSRSALMTGCYPLRLAMERNVVEVHPRMHSKEVTIAEVLKSVGYVTAAFGKWDLAGHSQTKYSPGLLPLGQGFDYFLGTPSSNDSVVHLMRGNEVIEKNADMGGLTQRYTDEAIGFMRENKDRPFFVYLAHTMPHIKLAVTDSFRGKSEGGIYGDVIEELDWNVGRLLDALKEDGLDEDTYVIFTSDNGPWFLGRSRGHLKRIGKDAEAHGGSALPLRGAKTSTWEGGFRVPCIMRAPGRIPAGRECDEVASTMDLLPTFSEIAGAEVPGDRVIDGGDVSDLMHGVPGAKGPTESFFYYRRTRLEAVRAGKWKLHVPRPAEKKWDYYSKAADVFEVTSPMLFDLEEDISESKDVAAEHAEVVARLLKMIEWARGDIGDHDRVGENARFFDPGRRRPDIGGAK